MEECIPSTYDTFLPALRVERLAQAFDGIVHPVDIAIRDLQRLCIAVNWPDGLLDNLAACFQTNEGAPDPFGETIELLEVGVQHFHLGTLLRVGSISWRNHNDFLIHESASISNVALEAVISSTTPGESVGSTGMFVRDVNKLRPEQLILALVPIKNPRPV